MEDFNSDNAKLDAALGTLAQTVTGHTTALAQKGNCRIERTTYIGNGSTNGGTVRISFSAAPLLFIIRSGEGIVLGTRLSSKFTYILRGPTTTNAGSSDLTWSGNTAQLTVWSYTAEINQSGETYEVYALYDLDS